MFSATIANLLLRLNEWIISTTLKKSFTRSIKRKSTMVSYNRCYRLQPLMTLPGTTVIQGIDIECTHILKVQKSCMWILKKYINNYIYYIDESVLLGTKPLVDLIRHFIRDPSGDFPYVTFVSVISFNDIRFVSYIVLKFVGVSSKHLRVFLGSLPQSSEIFGHLRKFSEILGKCSGTFVWYSEQFWKIFGNLRKVVGNLRKIIKNAVINMST